MKNLFPINFVALTVFLLLNIKSIHAQEQYTDVEITHSGDVEKSKYNKVYIKTIMDNMNNTYYFAHGSFHEKFQVESFDSKSELIGTSETLLKDLGKGLDYYDIEIYGNEIYLLTTRTNQKESIHSIYRHKLNKNTLVFGSAELIGSMKYEGKLKKFPAKTAELLYFFPENCIRRAKHPRLKDGHTYFDIAVYDSEFNETFSKNKVVLPDVANLYNLKTSSEEDLWGNVLITNEQGENEDFVAQRYDFKLFHYDMESDDMSLIDIQLKGKYIIEFSHTILPSGNIQIMGFYRENKDVTGVFSMQVNTVDFSTTEPSFIVSNADNEQLLNSSGFKAIDQSRLLNQYTFHIADLHVDQDGGVSMTAQHYYDNAQLSAYMKSASVTYKYGNVFVAKSSSDGDLEWVKQIEKYSNGYSNLGFGLYTSVYLENKMLILINRYTNDEELKAKNPNGTVLIEIENDGSSEEYMVFSEQEELLMYGGHNGTGKNTSSTQQYVVFNGIGRFKIFTFQFN